MTSIWWNFKLTTLKLIMYINSEKIGKWQRFSKNFELSGTSD